MRKNGREDLYIMVDYWVIVCKKIKNMFFKDKKWQECYRDVANKFTQMKKICRPCYPNLSENQFLETISKYSDADILDVFAIQAENV